MAQNTLVKNVVLVHGAFADGSSWSKVIPLLQAKGLHVRNRIKIEAAVRNARAFLKVKEDFGAFDSYCWRFVGGLSKHNRCKATRQIPTTSSESETFSKDLKQRGFSFVGPTVIYAFMQAVGMVNDHVIDCFRHREILSEAANAD